MQVLLGAGDAGRGDGAVAAGRPIAVTGATVRTLQAMQFKGTITDTVVATEAEHQRGADYADAFFAAVESIDGTPRERLERIRPVGLLACRFVVEELFDQTPGPGAGAAILAPGETP